MKKKLLAIFTTVAVSLVLVFSLVGCMGSSDGRNGKDFDLYSVYQQLVDKGEFAGTYSEFVKQYLSVEVDWDKETSFATAINSSLAAVVSIAVQSSYTYNSGRPFGGTATTTITSSGSGVIYSLDKKAGDAYILTNCHVVYTGRTTKDGVTYTPTGTPSYKAYLYGLEYAEYAIPFTVVGYSMTNDVAVLKVENSDVLKESMAQAATVGNSDELAVGDKVFLIGNPKGDGISATSGIVSVESEEVGVESADGSSVLTFRSVRTDAAANHGNSGGGMFDVNGRLTGLLFAGNESAQGIGNVLPINTVVGVADSILDNCDGKTITTKKARLGVTVNSGKIEQVFDADRQKLTTRETLTVQSVSLGSAASGKLQAGDVLVSVTIGNTVQTLSHQWQLSDVLWRVRAGDETEITVLRGGERVTEQISFSDGDFAAVA